MKIMTWNIQNGGVGCDFQSPDVENIQHILGTIEHINPDVIVIQEYQTEYRKQLVEDGLDKMSYKCSAWKGSEDKTLRKRVLIASKEMFCECERPTTISDYSKRNWNEIFIPAYDLVIVGVDVPLAETCTLWGSKIDNRREKKCFLQTLMDKFAQCRDSETPTLILGDFNLHSTAVYKEYLDKFFETLVEITNEDPTWEDKKLDYVFANKVLIEKYSLSRTNKPCSTPFSDHKYICIDTESKEEFI